MRVEFLFCFMMLILLKKFIFAAADGPSARSRANNLYIKLNSGLGTLGFQVFCKTCTMALAISVASCSVLYFPNEMRTVPFA